MRNRVSWTCILNCVRQNVNFGRSRGGRSEATCHFQEPLPNRRVEYPSAMRQDFFDPLEGPWGLKLVQNVLVRYPFEETVRQKRWVQTSLSSSKSDRL